MKKRAAIILILILSFFGIADAAYVAQHEASGSPLLCNIQSLSGCNVVVGSHYSYVFGISLAVYGMLFYGIIFVLSALELVIIDQLLRRVLQALALFGIVVSLYSVVLQAFVIHAYCVYCLGSVVVTVLILVFASLIEPVHLRNRKEKNADEPKLPPVLPMPPRS